MRKFLLFLAAVLLFFLFFSVTSGRFLVVNSPEHSDVIVVLAGETDRRPSRALELYSQGYAGRVLIDVPSRSEEHTSELQSRFDLVCRLLLEKKKNIHFR